MRFHFELRACVWQVSLSWMAVACATVASAQTASQGDGPAERMVDAYVKAWNAGDADALARMWAPDGELIDADGNVVDRKALLAARLNSGEAPRPKLAILLDRVQLLAPNIALVDGVSRLTSAEGALLRQNRFTGILLKKDDAWQIRVIRQLSSEQQPSPQPAPAEPLSDLDWLVGEWSGLGDEMHVQISTRWDLGRRYLVSRCTYEPANGSPYEAEVRAGWDPQAASVKSWYFDSRGGVSTAIWQRNDGHWLAAIRGTQPDGESFTGTMAITQVDKDSYLRTVTGLESGGRKLPDRELRIFRVAPHDTR